MNSENTFLKLKNVKRHQMKLFTLYSTAGLLINISYVSFPEKSALCNSEDYNAIKPGVHFYWITLRKPQLIHSSYAAASFSLPTALRSNYPLSKRKSLNDFEEKKNL